MNYTKEQMRQRFEQLDSRIKKEIGALDMHEISENLQQKYKLHIDQAGQIAKEVMLVLLGLTAKTDFSSRIATNTGVSTDTANLIIYDLNQLVFLPLRARIYGNTNTNTDNVGMDKKNTPKDDLTRNIGTQTTDTFSQKMTADYGLAREKVEIADQPKQNQPPAPEDAPPRHDPYREPLL